MPKSRLDNPFNSVQRYVFPSYLTNFWLVFLTVCAYVCISELSLGFLLVFQEVEPDDLVVSEHVAGQVDQPYQRRRPRQDYRPDVQPMHRVFDFFRFNLFCSSVSRWPR